MRFRIVNSKVRRGALAISLILLIPHGLRGSNFTWEASPFDTDWENVLNWAGPAAQIPDDNTDTALVSGIPVGGFDPLLTVDRTIGALTIQANGDVDTGTGAANFSLLVQNNGGQSGTILIEGAGSSLNVFQSGAFFDVDTDNLTINSGGTLNLNGGARFQVDDLMDLNTGGTISGSGILEINGTLTAVNDGVIRAAGGTLTIERSGTSTATLDFDGLGENGAFDVAAGSTLIIDMPLTGPLFDGTMTIGNNGELQINQLWTLENTAGTVLDFNGGVAGTARLSGSAAATLSGVVNINSGTAIWAAPTTVDSAAVVTLAAATTLRFAAPTTIANPNSIVNGITTTFVVNDVVNIGTGAGDFDWDGPNGFDGATTVNPNGVLNLNVGTVDFGASPEIYNGTITMNSGDISVQVTDNQWEMAGTLHMSNTAANSPTLSGEQVLISGIVQVDGTGESLISAAAIFGSTSSTSVALGAEFGIQGSSTTIQGGTWGGQGVVNLDSGTTTIASSTIVNMPAGAFDVDGDFAAGTVVLNSDLTLNVNSVDDDGGSLDSTLRINNFSRFTANLTDPLQSYTIAGSLQLNGPASPLAATQIAGSDVFLTGTVDVAGNSISAAVTTITGTVNVAAAGSFNLRGGTPADPDRIAGGTVNGLGLLRAFVGNETQGFGTINVGVDFAGVANLRADNGVLNVNGGIVAANIVGTADIDGTLNVTTPWNTNVAADSVELRGGRITGAAIVNDNRIRGVGRVASNGVDNSGVISATSGGTLELATVGAIDLDGTTGLGTVEASLGNVHVISPVADEFDGTIFVGASRFIQLDTGWTLGPTGKLVLNGGAVPAQAALVTGGTQLLGGLIGVNLEARFDAPTRFLNTAQVSIPAATDALRLAANTRIDAGASFSGAGRLINTVGTTLLLADNANVGVALLNSGRLEVGTSPGIALVSALTQTGSGTVELQIDGTTVATQYDRILVLGAAALAGTLTVPVNDDGGVYADPAVGNFDQFTLISATSVAGTFSDFIYDGSALALSFSGAGMNRYHVGSGLFRILDYDASQVDLLNYRALPGDANGDGFVDGSDFGIWNSNKFTAGTGWTTGDFNGDGVTDGTDFGIWNSNKFTSIPLGRLGGLGPIALNASLSVVPEPTSWTVVGLGLFMLLRRRKC